MIKKTLVVLICLGVINLIAISKEKKKNQNSEKIIYNKINLVESPKDTITDSLLSGSVLNFSQARKAIQFIRKTKGLDFCIIDKNVYSFSELKDIISVADDYNIQSLIYANEPWKSKLKLLNTNTNGIIIPNVEFKEQAEKLVKYKQSISESKKVVSKNDEVDGHSGETDLEEPEEVSNKDIELFVTIESKKGLLNQEEILSVSEINGCLIGLEKITTDLGTAAKSNH